MKKHNLLRIGIAVIIGIVCTVSASNITMPVGADNIADLEAEIDRNNSEINRKREELEQLELESATAREYMTVVIEKIELQQDNIDMLSERLYSLDNEIYVKECEIQDLEDEIAEKKDDIDKKIETFRQWLRYMYMNENDGISSVLIGTTDFYDFLARAEIAACIADYDKKLIDELNTDIDDLEKQNESLEQQKNALLAKHKALENKRDVLQGEINAVIDEYTEAYVIVQELMATSDMAQEDIEWLNSQNMQIDQKIDRLKEEERKAAEKARLDAEKKQKGAIDAVEPYEGDRQALVEYAKTYLGVYYQWAGNYPAKGHYGLDCSHFTYRVMEHFGLMYNYMDSRVQSRYCNPISRDELLPGDLIFYKDSGGTVRHVTMYIGDGQVIGANGGDSWVDTKDEAESCNAKVKIVSLDSDRRTKIYGRIPGM